MQNSITLSKLTKIAVLQLIIKMDINYSPLSTLDIKRAISKDTRCNSIFKGVFASDDLPQTFSKPALFIVNTDPQNLPGTHWVAMYFDAKNYCEYFDSYGMPPTIKDHKDFIKVNAKNVKYNHNLLQSVDTSVCGHYCCVYIAFKARGLTLRKIVSKLKIGNSYSNDGNVILLFKKCFKFIKGRGKKNVNNTVCMKCCAKCKVA